MASTQTSPPAPASLERGQLGLFGVIMPGLAQVAPAFNLFFTTGLMVALAGASAPLIFLISMVGMIATASSLAQFSGVYPSAGSFITYITRAIGTRVAHRGRHHHDLRLHHRLRRHLHLRRQLHRAERVRQRARLGPDRHRHDRLRRPGGRAGGGRAEVRRPDHGRAVRVRGRAAARPERDDPGQGRERAACRRRRSSGRAARPRTCWWPSAWPCWPSAGSRPPRRWPRRPATRGAPSRLPCSGPSWSAGSSTCSAPMPWSPPSAWVTPARWPPTPTRSTPRPRRSCRSSPP